MAVLYLIKEHSMITGIEVLKFGVEDRQEANTFLADFGLKSVNSDIEGADL